jgi:quinol monooxygenase YgiN
MAIHSARNDFTMIIVQSTFELIPDSKPEALVLMKDMVTLCRKEYGCLSYEYYEGVTETNRVILFQEWENADCLQAHYQTEHMDSFIANLSRHLQSPIITRSYLAQEETPPKAKASNAAPKPQQTIH